MISTVQALAHLFDLVGTLPSQDIALRHAAGRTLARTVTANRDQPPFAASAMDGYAVCNAVAGASFTVIGEAAAGHAFNDAVSQGKAVRIFTGAPVPRGADRVVIQEDVRRDGDTITLSENLDSGTHIRPAGGDFTNGTPFTGPRVLSASDIALLASMNIALVPVTRKPVVAIIATGDELVQPGDIPNAAQIIASNSYGLAALLDAHGAETRLLPIARDTVPSLELAFDLAADADLIITIGGASVGDHDLVGQVALAKGMDRAFYKVAMRPGKPLMAGRIGTSAMIGLPGNPVSAMVCGHIFVLPVIRKMLGLGANSAPRRVAKLLTTLGPNGPREHYMRAHINEDGLRVYDRQDSALLSVLSQANCLAVRPPNDGPRLPGDLLEIIHI
ncbi:MAG: molybdopterin molybdotransferase MoeA [Yoonia sp.]|nr:molybdopterin molybdotransferase MoeA [Yoonia sp.]